jgi:hypothetical protein
MLHSSAVQQEVMQLVVPDSGCFEVSSSLLVAGGVECVGMTCQRGCSLQESRQVGRVHCAGAAMHTAAAPLGLKRSCKAVATRERMQCLLVRCIQGVQQRSCGMQEWE